MALVVAGQQSVSFADPTVSLKQSLSAFENVLTTKQKQEFQAQVPTPDAPTIIAFIAQLDACNAAQTKRCVAPRLHTFLDSLRQFTRVVDTFVSSNPRIAALLWGGVRLTLISANNVASYFDKVTNMVMKIGKTCPAYEQFSQLYPHHVGVQRTLCEYYAIFVRICTKIVEVSQRNLVVHTISAIVSPFEFEFKPFLEDLDSTAKEIQLQLLHASSEVSYETRCLLAAEQKENMSYRSNAVPFFKKAQEDSADAQRWRLRKAAREATRLRASVLQNLSAINYIKPWKQSVRQHVKGTTKWIQREPAFNQWISGAKSSILWCSGAMGMGKTVLVSSVVAYLHTLRKPGDIVSYYFCSSDDHASLSARNVIGSIVKQLLEVYIEHASGDHLQELYNSIRDLDTDQMVSFLLFHLDKDMKIYIILDGLDECKIEQILDIVLSIAILTEKYIGLLKILYSGRPELGNQLFKSVQPQYRISVSNRKTEEDMDCYIVSELDRCLEDEHLKLGNPEIIVKIRRVLGEKANGMFLWTRLAIEDLVAQGSDREILAVLENLPSGISELFARKIDRVKSRTRGRTAMRVLETCGIAKRPLTISELQEVLSIDIGQKSLDRAKLPNDMHSIIRDCCGLAFLDEEEETVHYVHHSVQQHLYGPGGASRPEFVEKNSDLHFGLVCMTYLDLADFKRQLSKTKSGIGKHIQPMDLGLNPVVQSNTHVKKMAQTFLHYSRQKQQVSMHELETKTQAIFRDAQASRLEELQRHQFRFLEYAKIYWIYHLGYLRRDTDEAMWRLFCRCLQGDDVSTCRPWETLGSGKSVEDFKPHESSMFFEDVDNTSLTNFLNAPSLPRINKCLPMLWWAVFEQHGAIFVYQSERLSLTEYGKFSFLSYAVKCASNHKQNRLVDFASALYCRSRAEIESGLMFAVYQNAVDVATILLQAGADEALPNTKSLDITARRGFATMVDALLSSRAKFGLFDLAQAATSAATNGYVDTTKRILAEVFDCHRQIVDWSLLCAAIASESIMLVDTLLKAGVNANATFPTDLRSPTYVAVRKEYADIMKLLYAYGDIFHSTPDGLDTSLCFAARIGHVKIVDRLLTAGADVNAAYLKRKSTPLWEAIRNGHVDVVSTLMNAGAKVEPSTLQRMLMSLSLEKRHQLIREVPDISRQLLCARSRAQFPGHMTSSNLSHTKRLKILNKIVESSL